MKHAVRVAATVSALVSGLVFAGPQSSSAARVAHAVEGYVNAISKHDTATLARIFADDAVVEFVGDDPGATLSVHADSLLDEPGYLPVAAVTRVSDLQVFPTRDGNAVFVQYNLMSADRAQAVRNQVALVEMNGNRITRMVNFNSPPASLAQARACATPRDVILSRR